MNPDGTAAWARGLLAGLVLTPLPVFLFFQRIAADDEVWTWTYLNKRWLVAAYLLAVSTMVVFPVLFARLRKPTVGAAAKIDAPSALPRSSTARAARLLAIVALVWWFAGPPWHLERHHREVESHEQSHLGALQAISKGYVPFVGPASTQYGPGSQLLLYTGMRLNGRFDIVSFRRTWAALNLTAFLIVGVVAFTALDFRPAIAVVVLSAVYSPFAFFNTAPDGTLRGFYGWANGFRYLAPLIVVPFLARASLDAERGAATPSVVILGVVWGLGAYVSPENFSSTAASAGLLLTLLCGTGTIRVSTLLRLVRNLLAGFAPVAAIVLLWYSRHGDASAFVSNYFSVPRAVAAGFQNTWWPANGSSVRTFYALPPLLVALTVAALWRLPSLALNAPLDAARVRFLAFASVQLMCYQVALLRSDPEHLQNTTIALPFVLVLAAIHLPRWIATPSLKPSTVRWLFIAVIVALLPAGRLIHAGNLFFGPLSRFTTPGGPSPTVDDPRVAYARATPLLTDEPSATGYDALTMREWLDFANGVHDLVGTRKVYVADVAGVWTGPLYFFADLTPAPYPLDRDTMTLNASMMKRVVDHIAAHPEDYECFIGSSIDAADARAFLRGHPDADRVDRPLRDRMIHILLARTR